MKSILDDLGIDNTHDFWLEDPASELAAQSVKYYDFGIPYLKLIIEVDSRRWHQGKRKVNDYYKTKLSTSKGFMVARIPTVLLDPEIKARVVHAVSQAIYKSYEGTPYVGYMSTVDAVLKTIPNDETIFDAFKSIQPLLLPYTVAERWLILFLAEWKRRHTSFLRPPTRRELARVAKLLRRLDLAQKKVLLSTMIEEALDIASNPPAPRRDGFVPKFATVTHSLDLVSFCKHYDEIAKDLRYV